MIPVGGGEPVQITKNRPGLQTTSCRWSPDGKYIISSKHEKDSKEQWDRGHFIYRVSSEGGDPEELNIKGRCPAYSPDGKKIAFSRRLEGYYEFWMVENFLPKEKENK